jgi:phosphatidylethanolamine-binding protein (PEBP) family uncharacterized protein
MQRSNPLALGAFVALIIAIAGCGSSSSSASPTSSSGSERTATTNAQTATPTATTGTTQSKSAPVEPPSDVRFKLTSPVFQQGRPTGNGERGIAARYTCDGSDVSPPLHWSGVPAGTAELVLLVIDASGHGRGFVWSMAHINPRFHSIAAGKLPSAAILGRNEEGRARYRVCPPRGSAYSYAVFLYALRKSRSLHSGFDPNKLYEEIGGLSLPQGNSGFTYKRA